MSTADLKEFYRRYIACINLRDWSRLAEFVGADVCHNGRRLGVQGYRELLEKDFADIPDLRFVVEVLVADAGFIASRLRFNCSPSGSFLGLPVNGKRISFAENVFYEIHEGKITRVLSVIDKQAIETQL